jgi:hypothetical protein
MLGALNDRAKKGVDVRVIGRSAGRAATCTSNPSAASGSTPGRSTPQSAVHGGGGT